MKSWFAYLKGALARRLPEDKLAAGQKKDRLRANLKNLVPFIKRHWSKGALGALLILLTSLLAFPGPLITRYLIDKVILGKQLSLLLGVILLLAGIKVGRHPFRHPAAVFFHPLRAGSAARDPADPVRPHPAPAQILFRRQGDRLPDVAPAGRRGRPALVFLLDPGLHVHVVLRFAGGAVFLLYLNWRLALAVLVVLPLMFVSVRFFGRKLRVLSHHGMERQAEVYQSVQESLAQTSLIKAFATEKRTLNSLMGKLRASLQVGMEQQHPGLGGQPGYRLRPRPGPSDRPGRRRLSDHPGPMELGSLLAFQSYVGFVYGPAQFLASANFQWQGAVASLERVSALFDVVPEEHDGVGLKAGALRGEVEFRNVFFSYNGQDTVLEDISFTAMAGEHMAIVGPSGVGKTTLVSLLLQFYRPQKGEILIDGRPAGGIRIDILCAGASATCRSRRRCSSGTIAENLRYGDPEAAKSTDRKSGPGRRHP